ncbi:MAG: Methyltransferase type 12 [Parcubacteria group bacterium GW2011_GWC2_42_12]|nr:MAG: Methyltransferase type 12 [Parcubacteria group bacterium GW2011_GWC2_42_12]KKT45192.1 MAG: Methyltransferase type 12 [Parcubacteria group bacterium GW2011_GWA2_44_15]
MIIFIIVYSLSLIFILSVIVCCINIVFSVLSFAPWVPSRSRDLSRIFKLADLQDGQIFYDLGCGDGKIVIYASDHYKALAIGLEIFWPLYLICRLRQVFKPNAKFKFKNLFKEDLSSADVVYFFGIPKTVNGKLAVKLKQELKPGAKAISYSFKLNDWTPKIIDKPTKNDLPIYLYEV